MVATVAPDLHRHHHHPLFEDWKTECPGDTGRVDRGGVCVFVGVARVEGVADPVGQGVGLAPLGIWSALRSTWRALRSCPISLFA